MQTYPFFEISDEKQLEILDSRLLDLRREKSGAEGPYWRGRDVYSIKKDIEDLEYERRLLFDRLSIKRISDTHTKGIGNFFSGEIKGNTVVGKGATLLRFQNESHKEKKDIKVGFWEKPWFQIIILISALATIFGVFLSSFQ